jgi:beta-carotene ketolase (CrtO type)
VVRTRRWTYSHDAEHAEDVLNEWFDSEFLKAPLARLASELGAPTSKKALLLAQL